MSSLVQGFEYDIFISYRHKDNKYDGWVSDFVANLKRELGATLKDEVSVYFDENPTDGLLETHNVDKSLQQKLKCLIFIPIVSQTYCDPKSFAWQHEFCAFNRIAKADSIGRDIKLKNGNFASRILSIKIHSLDPKDKALMESELGEILRSIDFIFKSAGVNRPLRANEDHPQDNINRTFYRDQLNKVANAVKEIISSVRGEDVEETGATMTSYTPTLPGSGKSNKLLVMVLLFLLALAAGWFAYTGYRGQTTTTLDSVDKSIAVLPFANMSSDPEQEYFSNGLTEDIITQLAKVNALKVISRTSVMQYKEFPKPVKEVGREMGVTYVLVGSVQRGGDQVRISAQLIEAATDKNIWAESYDRPLKDIFSIQREVATAIASVLKGALTTNERNQLGRAKTTNLQAYDFYLHGKYAMEERSRSDMYKAKSYFEQAIALDSGFALAYSGLAEVNLLMCNRGYVDSRPVLEETKKYIDKALELDPLSAEIQTSSGYWHNQNFNFREAEARFRKSIEMNPNQDNVYNWLAQLLEQTGRDLEALDTYDQGIAVNPSFSLLKANMLNLLMTINSKDALRMTTALIDSSLVDPDERLFYLITLSKYYWVLGRKSDAASVAEQAGIEGLAKFYQQGNNNELVSAVTRNYQEIMDRGEYVSALHMGVDYAAVGARRQALENFETAIDIRDPALPVLLSKGFYSVIMIKENDPAIAKIREQVREMITYDWPTRK
ncbi:MAG TPA: tetratricopeptide repeat protein [Chryseolinea sp.]|nr:tetratricopeptide repeat protein [Chryseolinea sp.]